MELRDPSESSLSFVRSFLNTPQPSDDAPPPAEFPGHVNGSDCATCTQPVEEYGIACDACERVFHVGCAGTAAEVAAEEWLCSECVGDGAGSARWQLGMVPRHMNSGGDGDYSRDSSNSRFELRKASGHVTHTADKLRIKDLPSLSRKLRSNHSAMSQAPEYLQRLKEFISERHGVLEEGWRVEIIISTSSDEPNAVYYAPDGTSFNSMPEVASHLGLFPNNDAASKVRMGGNKSTLVPRTPLGKGRFSFKSSVVSDVTEINGCSSDYSMGASQAEDGVEKTEEDTGSLFSPFSEALPIQYENFFLLSLGQVDARPSYHSTNQIIPVGYKSCWHDELTGSLFVCEVLDGGDGGPVFRVSRSSCFKLPNSDGSTVLFLPDNGESKEEHNRVAGTSFDDEEHRSLQLLISDPPPEHDRICSIGSSLETSSNTDIASVLPDTSSLKDEIGEFYVEEPSSSSAWRMVAKKFVDTCREMYAVGCTFNFCCEHVGHGPSLKVSEFGFENTLLRKFSSYTGSFKVGDEGCCFELDNVFKWLDEDRFGLEIDFVQEFIELLPGVEACTQYTPLKDRSCCSSSVTVGNGLMSVKKNNGMQMKGEEALLHLCGSGKRARTEMAHFPKGKPMCTKFPVEIVGDVVQVLEVLQRFSDVISTGNHFSPEQIEMELSSPYLYDLSIQKFGVSIPEDSHLTRCALSKAQISLLKLLIGELQTKVTAILDPSSDVKESKSKRGKRKSMDLSMSSNGKIPNMLPINVLTWPEMARSYVLAVLSRDSSVDSETRKVYGCLVGDGVEFCGALTGALGMEADLLLLAQAMKKIFGTLEKEYDTLSVDDVVTDQPSACESTSPIDDAIPEWAQLLEPVRKLPTNVGARIRKCVYSALEKSPPEWAKKLLEHSISKEVYKGNASGPTKKAILSVLATVSAEGDGKKPGKERKKPVEERKGRKYVSVCDLVMKKCRIILRRIAKKKSAKVFCNLLGRRLINCTEIDEVCILGSPAMVSHPLDLRTIDLRLAVGAYDGSHIAFLEDVREFWSHVHIAYSEKPDILQLACKLATKFEALYEEEIVGLYEKLVGFAKLGCLNAEAKKEVDKLIASLSELPKSPWDAGICKICGIDKDDNVVLLCDTCNAEYHTYCLNPPLAKVPRGNWHCPSCVKQLNGINTSAQTADIPPSYEKNPGEFTRVRYDALMKLTSIFDKKDYWEYGVTERVLLLKFLCDELLNSSLIHQHLEQCVESSGDLKQKLRLSYIDWKKTKNREEKLVSKIEKKNKSLNTEQSGSVSVSPSSEDLQRLEAPIGVRSKDSKDYCNELSSVRSVILDLRNSIMNMEMKLMKQSGRREFLGADSSGRLYWVWAQLGQLCLIVNHKKSIIREDLKMTYPHGAYTANFYEVNGWPWVVYESLEEIKEVVDFLRDNDSQERDLKKIILWRFRLRLQDPENEGPGETQTALPGEKSSNSESLVTVASRLLENIYGPWSDVDSYLLGKQDKKPKAISDDKLIRCNCLEPVVPSRLHCLSCHKTFLTNREFDYHSDECCELGQSKGDTSSKNGDSNLLPKQYKHQEDGLFCPHNFDYICSKFVTLNSLKELVREIGLLGSDGVSLFLPSVSPNFADPTLRLNEGNNSGQLSDESRGTGPTSTEGHDNNCDGSLGRTVVGIPIDKPLNGSSDQNSSEVNKCCTTPKSSLVPLVGKAYFILIQLKMNLLDMEAALPKAALRPSRADYRRRWAWRFFVKCAGTIDDMVQAIIVFEDMIRPAYLKNTWWYWSSLSAAAKISTVSALALRIYSLDSFIIYEKSSEGSESNPEGAAKSKVVNCKRKKLE